MQVEGSLHVRDLMNPVPLTVMFPWQVVGFQLEIAETVPLGNCPKAGLVVSPDGLAEFGGVAENLVNIVKVPPDEVEGNIGNETMCETAWITGAGTPPVKYTVPPPLPE